MPEQKFNFKIRNLSRGAQKARLNMMRFYGSSKGEDIWVKKAEERGKGSTLRQKLNSIYHKGTKLK
jgi:hypothetical protein